ncbi:MAG: cation:proton antiporter, partial [Lachnospiraceae bacterium]|nr:cation:proton antiporter [Lachnospiraceae bacterium]
MENFLVYLAAVLFLIVVCVMFNDKVTKFPTEIAILMFSLIIGIILKIIFNVDETISEEIMSTISEFRIDKVLMDCLLCFMLFTGASELKLPSLVNNFKPIALLALLTTVVSSVLYGALFYLVTLMIGIDVSFTLCVLLGSIVSPTDPIAATSILSKMGLTKNVTAVMEGESLFNDGTGVALFIFVKELFVQSKGGNFFAVMGRELFGAVVAGLAISFVFSFFIKATKDPIKHILISTLTVALCYVVCDDLEFSGVIASVVCGIYFSTLMDRYKATERDLDPDNYYKDFWSVIDKILNYILYAMIGISFVYVTKIKGFIIVTLAAIIFN